MTDSTPRPTPDQWLAQFPTLKKVGSQLQGPCPLCGGTDRFHVKLDDPHLFGCRQCEDGPGILRVAFGDPEQETPGTTPVRRPRRPNSDFLIAEYHTAAGKLTEVFRKDWPEDWDGRACDFKDCKAIGRHKHVWRGKGQPYRNLLLLLWPPSDPVDADLIVVCEGEKAAKAVQLAGYTGASYCGGVPSGARNADYSPVTGRTVLVWPDADAAGIKAGKDVVEKCYMMDALAVHLLPVEELEGLDAADYPTETIRQMVTNTMESDALPPPDVGVGVQGAPAKAGTFIQPDEKGLKSILDYLRLDLRENPRNLRSEIRRIGAPGEAKAWAKQWAADQHPGGWIPLTDGLEASLRQVSREHFIFQNDSKGNQPATWIDRDLRDAVLNNCPRPAVDPFRLWLEDGPEWDGVDRIAHLWSATLAMPDIELNREAGRRFLIGAVRRSFEPGCVHDWIPVLVGPQGLGKSSILRELVSPAREWFSDGTQLDGDPKTRMETTGPAVINEFSEMAGLDRAESARFKNYLTQRSDQLRRAYGKNAERTERRWVGAGTANPDPDGVLPADLTGSRRYVVMESSYKGSLDELAEAASRARAWVRDNLAQLWAEALHEYREAKKRGIEDMNLIPGHLRSAQEAAAEGFQRHFEGLREVADRLIDYGQDYERAHGYGPPIVDLMVQANLADTEGAAAKDRRTQIALAKELAGSGWARRQQMINGVVSRRWYPPLPEGQAIIIPADQGQCVDCGQVAKIGNLCDDCRAKRQNDLTGTPPGGEAPGTPPAQGPLDADLQVRIDAIDRELQEMRSEGVSYAEANTLTLKGENGLQAMGPADPQAYNLLRVKRNALQALRAAKPDKVVFSELLELWGGAAGVLAFIESHIDETPWVVWDSFDWIPILRDASALVQEQVKRERQVVRQQFQEQVQERVRQRLLQWPFPQVDGSPA